MKRISIGLLLALVIVIGLGVLIARMNVISPRNRTATNMTIIMLQTMKYVSRHHVLPPDLKSLPPSPSHGVFAMDGWKQPIAYAVDKAGVVTLTSLGSDHAQGGPGDAADMTASFETKDPSGNWLDQQYSFVKQPL